MEKIAELLKTFVEKHLIPTVISVGVAIGICVFTPNGFIVVQNLGMAWHGILVFCICFLLIQGVIALARAIEKAIHSRRYARSRDERALENEEELMETIWTYVDGLSPDDKESLMRFLETDNAPIDSQATYFGNSLFASDCVDVTTVQPEQKEVIASVPSGTPTRVPRIGFRTIAFSQPVKRYKLKNKFYELLKYSYEKYGRISHF